MNKLGLCLYKGELCFKVMKRYHNMAANQKNFDTNLIVTSIRFVQKYRKLSSDSVDTLNSQIAHKEDFLDFQSNDPTFLALLLLKLLVMVILTV